MHRSPYIFIVRSRTHMCTYTYDVPCTRCTLSLSLYIYIQIYVPLFDIYVYIYILLYVPPETSAIYPHARIIALVPHRAYLGTIVYRVLSRTVYLAISGSGIRAAGHLWGKREWFTCPEFFYCVCIYIYIYIYTRIMYY